MRPLPSLPCPVAAAENQPVGRLFLAPRARALGGLAPGRHRVAPPRGAALAAARGVVERGHGEAPPHPSGRDRAPPLTRDGKQVVSSTNTTTFRRSPAQIVEWSQAHDAPPDLVIIYTGGCVADGPLEAGSVVRISLAGIGYVENTVEVV